MMTKIEECIYQHPTGYASNDPKEALYSFNDVKEIVEMYIKEFRKSPEYMELLKDSEWLMCLESAGVDNWSGYEYAQDLMNERYEQ